MTNPMESPELHVDLARAEACAWLARLGGDVTVEDGVAFDAWLEAAPGNRAAYIQALAVWHELDARGRDGATDPATSPRRPAARRPNFARAASRRPTRVRWAAPAVGGALAAGLAVSILPGVMAPTTTAVYATAKGQHQHIVLADGSSIDVDAQTRLSVALSRSERRIILADGQAIFDVAHDSRRPFVVQAGGREIRDIGTQFDVRTHADQLTVTVARGSVAVGGSTAGRDIVLKPGQRLTVNDAGAGRLTAVDPLETFSWRSGRLVYRAQPLAEVVADLNRQFVEQTQIADPTLASLPITGVIVLDNPRAVMTRLSLMMPIKAVPSDQGLILQRK